MAAISLGQTGGVFESSLLVFSTTQEAPLAKVSLGNQLIYDVVFLDKETICAIGEDSVEILDLSGKILGSYSYENFYLHHFSTEGKDFITLVFNQYTAGNTYSVVTLDFKGTVRGQMTIQEDILSVSATGNYMGVLTSGELQIYTSHLKPYHQAEELAGASKIEMREDGSVILIGNGAASVYLP